MVGLLLEGGRSVGRGPAPRIALLSAPSHHREGSRNCELCSPFRCFHSYTWALYLIWDARSPSQWSRLHRPLPEPHREESHIRFSPALNSTCHPRFSAPTNVTHPQKMSPAQPPVAPSHSQLPATGNPPQSRSRNLNSWRARLLHNWDHNKRLPG